MQFAGVESFTLPTSLVPPVAVSNPVVAIGTSVKAVEKPKLIFTFDEYKNKFGYSGDYSKHTLDEVADVAFKLYKVSPVIFISIGTNANNATSKDVIDAITNWIDQLFFLFRKIPSTLIAPKFSTDKAVAIAMSAAVSNISALFEGMAIADIPDTVAVSDVPNYKNTNSLIDDNLILAYPSVQFNNKKQHMSTHLAFLQAVIDSKNGNIPYQVASNQRLIVEKASKTLTLDEANYLRSNGITTTLNFIGGWTAWGDRTSVYPANTDPVYAQIPIKRMFNYLNEILIRTYWSKVDKPLNKRLLKTIRDSINTMLDGWKNREIIAGGRCEILEKENPITDLLDGIVRLHIYWAPPSATRKIEFYQEYDVNYIKTLFA